MSEEALQHFRLVCQRELQFLIDQYNYAPAPLPTGKFINQFQYRLSNGTITLVVEGVNYGMNAEVSLEDNHGRSVSIICLLPGWEPFAKRKKRRQTKNQDEQIAEAAEQLKIYCQDVLNGNLARFNEIGDRLNRIRAKSQEWQNRQQSAGADGLPSGQA